jgi:2-polyprenyl-3-methyl-5-hydroxy-6-metoxy-1,4-benzoquinol methylase
MTRTSSRRNMGKLDMKRDHYVIRGGIEGRERLRVLSRVMQPTTLSLFNRVNVGRGMVCLDVGCGGGDVTFNLAQMVGSEGRVVGIDIDETKLQLARQEAEGQKLSNVEFQLSDIRETRGEPEFDLVYARFLLTHLSDPKDALTKMRQLLKLGGLVVVEDIDFTGYFCYPDFPAFRRYVELYTEAVRRKGGDANIGARLPLLFLDAGFSQVEMNVVQPMGISGEVKLINPITMENIAESVITLELTSQDEVKSIIAEIHEFADNPRTVAGLPRVVQAWGYKQGIETNDR